MRNSQISTMRYLKALPPEGLVTERTAKKEPFGAVGKMGKATRASKEGILHAPLLHRGQSIASTGNATLDSNELGLQEHGLPRGW